MFYHSIIYIKIIFTTHWNNILSPPYHHHQQQQPTPTDQPPQPTTTGHPHRSTTDHQYQPLLPKKKKKKHSNKHYIATNLTPTTHNPIWDYPKSHTHNSINLPPSTKISQATTIKTTNHQKRERERERERSARLESDDDDVVMMTMALLVLDVGDDDGSCAVSGELARLGNGSYAMSGELVAHAACTFGDNGHYQTNLKLKGKERTEGIGGWEERELVRENRGEREEKRIKRREMREKRE